MIKLALFVCSLAILSTVVLSTEDTTELLEGDTVAPCSNGSAIYNVSLTDEFNLKGFCRPFDNCTRYCYNSPNCTEDAKSPPNKQVFITAINNTKEEQNPDANTTFRCCASSLKLKDCVWKTVKGGISVPENETISDIVVISHAEKLMEVKICQIDEEAGQPTAKTVCFADVCLEDGYCYGHHVTQTVGPMIFNDDIPYGLLGLLILDKLADNPAVCEKLSLPAGVIAISYPQLNTVGKIPVGGLAVATCTSGLFFPTGLNIFQTICTSGKTFAPTVPTCAAPGVTASTTTDVSTTSDTSAATTPTIAPSTVTTTTTPSITSTTTTPITTTTTSSTTTTSTTLPTCPLPVFDPVTQSVSYSLSIAPNGQLLDGTVASVTCTVATDTFSDGTIPPLTITCSTGSLSRSVSPCVPNCPKLTVPSNGIITYASGVCAATSRCTVATTAQLSCNSGYTALTVAGSVCSVPPTATCDGTTRQFSPDTSTTYLCARICIPLSLDSTIYTVAYSPSGCAIFDTNVATITCMTGMYYPDATTTRQSTCTNGVLSAPIDICKPTCPPPVIDPLTQTVSYTPALAPNGQLLDGTVATVTCTLATDIFSDGTTVSIVQTCSAGTLSEPPIIPCVPTCPELTDPQNGAYSYAVGICSATSLCTGTTTAVLSCDVGYTPVLSATSVCSTPPVGTCDVTAGQFIQDTSVTYICAEICADLSMDSTIYTVTYSQPTCPDVFEGIVATITCAAGLYYPDGTTTRQSACSGGTLLAPTDVCSVFCPQLVNPASGTFKYSAGTCITQLCPLNTVATLTCPAGQVAVDTTTSTCVSTTTCGGGKVFSPYTTQLLCVPVCTALSMDATLYTVTYSPSGCAILNTNIATVTCVAGLYYPDATTTRQSTCTNGVLLAPSDVCKPTCAPPTIDPLTQTVSYTPALAPNGQLLDGTVATVTCTLATDIFSDGTTAPIVQTCSAGTLSLPPIIPCVPTCQQLTDPTNGQFSYAVGICSATLLCTATTTAEFTCDIGYTPVLSAGSICSDPPIGTCDGTTGLFTPDTSITYSCAEICADLSMDSTIYTVTYSQPTCPDVFEGIVATITCAAGLYYPDGTTTRQSTCSGGTLLAPTDVCSVFCPQLVNPASGTFKYSAGTCITQLCPLNTVATLTCPAGQVAVDTTTSTCVSTTTCGVGKVFSPYTTQLLCVPVCTALSLDTTTYTVTYSPSGCAIFSTNVATITCVVGFYYSDVTTFRTSTCTNGVLLAPTDVCKPTCPVPAINPTTQAVTYSTTLAPNGKLLDGTVATVTCTSSTDLFSDLTVTLTITCAAGALSPSVIPCVKTCPILTAPANGVLTYASGVCLTTTSRCPAATTVKLTCNVGYTVATVSTSTCSVAPLGTCDGTTGLFTPDPTTTYMCAQTCPALSLDPTRYTMTYSPTACAIVETNVATIICATGMYYPDGTATRTSICTSGILAPPPACMRTCSPLAISSNQGVTYSRLIATYGTNGQLLDGTNAIVTCTVTNELFTDGRNTPLVIKCVDGTWDTPLLPCVSTCPKLTAPTSGTLSYGSAACTNAGGGRCVLGSTATLTCNSGTFPMLVAAAVTATSPVATCASTGSFGPIYVCKFCYSIVSGTTCASKYYASKTITATTTSGKYIQICASSTVKCTLLAAACSGANDCPGNEDEAYCKGTKVATTSQVCLIP